jgi:membrane protein implicated in regulation of membrane protease activity
MYGKWFLIVFGLGAAALLVIGLAVAYTGLIAVAIGVMVALVIVIGLSSRRTSQVGSERESAARERGDGPEAIGAPVSGEGDAAAAHRPGSTRGPA